MQTKKTLGNLLLLMTAVIWGLAFTAQKIAGDRIPPFALNGIRFLLGALVLIPALFVLDRTRGNGRVFLSPKNPHFIDLTKRELLGGIACGAALLASAEAYAEEYGGWSGFYSSLEDRQQNLSAVLGDAVFTRSGDRCTAQPSVKSLLGGEEDDMVGVSGSYTLNTATGAASGDLTLDIKGSLFPVANLSLIHISEPTRH